MLLPNDLKETFRTLNMNSAQTLRNPHVFKADKTSLEAAGYLMRDGYDYTRYMKKETVDALANFLAVQSKVASDIQRDVLLAEKEYKEWVGKLFEAARIMGGLPEQGKGKTPKGWGLFSMFKKTVTPIHAEETTPPGKSKQPEQSEQSERGIHQG